MRRATRSPITRGGGVGLDGCVRPARRQQMGNYRNALEAVSGNRISFTNRCYNGAIAVGGGW